RRGPTAGSAFGSDSFIWSPHDWRSFRLRSPPGAGPQPQPPSGSPYSPLGSFGSDSFIWSPHDWRSFRLRSPPRAGPPPQPPSRSPSSPLGSFGSDSFIWSPHDWRGPARSGRSAPIRSSGRLTTGGAQPARVVRLPLPLPRAFHGAAPAFVMTRACGGVHCGLEGPLDARARGQCIERAPEPGPHASQIRRTQAGRLGHHRPDDRDVENIRLKLAEEVVRGGAAIDA